MFGGHAQDVRVDVHYFLAFRIKEVDLHPLDARGPAPVEQLPALRTVRQTGPACHTGETTCFYRGLNDDSIETQRFEAPGELQTTLDARRAEMPEGSYTTELLSNPPFIAEKVLEEAEEVTRAAREETDDRVANEAADVIYHLAVLMTQRGLSLQDAFEVLNERAR